MKRIFLSTTIIAMLFLGACGEDDTPSDPCATPFNVDLETTRSSADGATGSVTITVTGSNGGLMYTLNQGSAQSGNTFNNLAVGSYTLLIEDSEGCSQTASFSIEEELNPSFATDINPIIQSNCATSGCHVQGGSAPSSFSSYSQIAARAQTIKARVSARTMPPSGSGQLTQTQIDLIVAWVDQGAEDN